MRIRKTFADLKIGEYFYRYEDSDIGTERVKLGAQTAQAAGTELVNKDSVEMWYDGEEVWIEAWIKECGHDAVANMMAPLIINPEEYAQKTTLEQIGPAAATRYIQVCCLQLGFLAKVEDVHDARGRCSDVCRVSLLGHKATFTFDRKMTTLAKVYEVVAQYAETREVLRRVRTIGSKPESPIKESENKDGQVK